jgi:hypothetical protein
VELSDYMIYKAIALVVIAFVGNFAYSFITGRSLTEDRNGKPTDTTAPEDRQT